MSAEYTTRVTESVLARLHFVVHTDPARCPTTTSPRSRRASPRRRAPGPTTCTTRWSSSSARSGGRRAARRYGDAFPAAYRDDFTPRLAVADIDRMERLDPAGDLGAQPLPPARATAGQLRFKLVRAGQPDPALRRAAAAREHGRQGHRRAALRGAAARRGAGLDLRLRAPARRGAELRRRGRARDLPGRVRAASGAARPRTTASTAWCSRRGSTAREVAVLRAIAKYLRQAGSTFSQAYMEDALAAHPDVARGLVELFHAAASTRRDPSDADAQARALEQRSRPRSTRVASLDEDRILRSFLRVDPGRRCGRTTSSRTRTGRPKPYLSFKLDPEHIPDLPAAAADVRDLRLLAAGRRRPPARRQGRARRHPLVGPARGLPHRGPRPDEGADGEERGHRAGRREGRLRRQAAAGRATERAARGGRRLLPDVHPRPARRHRQPRRRRGRPAARRRAPRRATIRTSSSPPTRARPRSPTSPTRSRPSTGSGSATPSRPAARPATTTRRWASPRAAPGSRSSATSASSASTSQTDDFTVVGIGDMSGDVFGNGMLLSRAHQARRRVRPPARLPRPRPRPGGELRRARAPVRAAGARPGPTTTRR